MAENLTSTVLCRSRVDILLPLGVVTSDSSKLLPIILPLTICCDRSQVVWFSLGTKKSCPYFMVYANSGYDHVRNQERHNVLQSNVPSEQRNKAVEEVKSKLRPDAKEFVPSCSSSMFSSRQESDASLASGITEDIQEPQRWSYAVAVSGKERAEEDRLCEHFIRGTCYFGDNCSFAHGNLCDMCFLPILHPTDLQQNAEHRKECLLEHEKDMEASFAVAQSKTMQCGICMEIVLDKKQVSGRRFGILEKCKHCFCIECIRKWRGQNRTFSNQIVRACPECRTVSDFVTPSSIWVEDEGEKQKLIYAYQKSMKDKPCKYFKEGRSECPFGNKCFYKHAKPDGTIVEGDSPATIRRRLRAQRRERSRNWIDEYFLVEFLERRGLGGDSDTDGDEDSDFGVDFDLSWDVWGRRGWSDSSDRSSESMDESWLLRALQDELRELSFTGAAAAAVRQENAAAASAGGNTSSNGGQSSSRGGSGSGNGSSRQRTRRSRNSRGRQGPF